MAIKVMADNNEEISVSQDAALYNVLAASTDFIIDGIGDEMEFNYNSSSLTASVSSGECVICGRHVTIADHENITLSANASGLVVIRYDTSQTGSNLCKVTSISAGSVQTDNLNNAGGVHDLVIGLYTTSASGVSSFTDERNIMSSVGTKTVTLTGAVSGTGTLSQGAVSIATSISTAPTILSGTSEPTQNQGKNGDIYILYDEPSA